MLKLMATAFHAIHKLVHETDKSKLQSQQSHSKRQNEPEHGTRPAVPVSKTMGTDAAPPNAIMLAKVRRPCSIYFEPGFPSAETAASLVGAKIE